MATPYPIPASVPFPHGASDARGAANRGVAAWLFVCCALVFAMVVVGGVTRLTHSGLSITEWQPIVGTVPPLSDAQWQEVFAFLVLVGVLMFRPTGLLGERVGG